MNYNPLIVSCLAKLDELLVRNFGAEGADFSAKAESAAKQLPNDLAEMLADLVRNLSPLRAEIEPNPERLGDFAFRCGELHAKLAAYGQVRMELENVVVGHDNVKPVPLAASEVEPLARFIEIRDRVFRKVADFTLKILLIGFGLLTLALIFGLL